MTNELHQLLDHIGYSARPQQEKLFDLLTSQDLAVTGVIAQAGTGTGKSIAVLAAAARAFHDTGIQSLVVTPTRILMDQYMAKDAPAAAECFNLNIAELRGKRWYECDLSFDLMGQTDDAKVGCLAQDAKCSIKAWMGIEEDMDRDWHTVEPHQFTPQYNCGYQEAKYHASRADIVVTNTDFWVINDRTLPDPIFALEGAVFVDEAHQLEAKLKDYAGRSIRTKELEKYYGDSGSSLVRALAKYKDGQSAKVGLDVKSLIRTCWDRGPDKRDNGTIPERAQEVQEGLTKIQARLDADSDNCLIWSDGWSLRMDYIDISPSARSLLTARPFGLVSATIPSSMPSALGVSDALVADVGHPFNYKEQARLFISKTDGSYRFASSPVNFSSRIADLTAHIESTKGGCLLLFSSFADMKRVYNQIAAWLIGSGRTVLLQNDENHPNRTNDDIAKIFKEDGSAVLFGSESFATGFDVPGDALELVGIWKLPYPGKDPVTDALAKRYYPRYRDLMLTRIVQAAGRLIRTETDRGCLFIADSRAEDIVKSQDLMVRHLGEFARG